MLKIHYSITLFASSAHESLLKGWEILLIIKWKPFVWVRGSVKINIQPWTSQLLCIGNNWKQISFQFANWSLLSCFIPNKERKTAVAWKKWHREFFCSSQIGCVVKLTSPVIILCGKTPYNRYYLPEGWPVNFSPLTPTDDDIV